MINILIPSMGDSIFFKDYFFPKPLTEIKGKTILEMVIDNYNSIKDKNFIFVFNHEDCNKFHLDLSVKILAERSKIIKLHNQTAGALCTCLMAIDHIDNETPLVITNSDQIINVDYMSVFDHFDKLNADAGLIIFPDIHPRWSYAVLKENEVVEVAEKRPFSKNAIAGFYYYKHGCDFINAAKKALIKQSCLNGKYYISSSINELILLGKKICFYNIQKNQYSSFYSPEKIKEYEDKILNESLSFECYD